MGTSPKNNETGAVVFVRRVNSGHMNTEWNEQN